MSLVLVLMIGPFFMAQSQDNSTEISITYTCPPCGCPKDTVHFETSGQCGTCNMELSPQITGLDLTRKSIPTPTVGIFIFGMADVMDVTGPLSVFEHAGFNIVTFALEDKPQQIGMNLTLKPDFTVENLPKVDILVFPGGGMAESNPGNNQVTSFIKNRITDTRVVMSVCSGAFFLGEAGVLDKQRATTFASMITQLKNNYQNAVVLNDVKYTDNGQIVTSAGLSSGIDAAFHVVSKFYGVGRAQDIANRMEYPWQRENDYARSQLADNYILGLKKVTQIFASEYHYSEGDRNQWEYRFNISQQIPANLTFALLKIEIGKMGNMEIIQSDANSMEVKTRHPELGAGNINIKVVSKKNMEQLVIMVNRAKSYTP